MKAILYLTVFFFSMYGIMCLKETLSPKEEGFTDNDDDKVSNEPIVKSDRFSLESTTSSSPTRCSQQDLMEELSSKISNSFTALKDSLMEQMDTTKEMIDNNIKKLISPDDEDTTPKTNSNLPSVKSFQLENTESTDDEASDIDEESEIDEEDITETFENGGFNGVTSPYCLNCFSYA